MDCSTVKPPPLSLRYYSPAAALRTWVSSYYIFETDLPQMSDILRAELPQVRFAWRGRGSFAFANGPPIEEPRAALCGPTNWAVKFEAEGPIRIFGAGLLPAGWAALVDVGANELADTMVDLEGVVGPIAGRTLNRMGEARSHREIVAAADAFFLLLSMRAKPPPLWFTRAADEWLTDNPDPDVNELVRLTGMSARQVERLTLRVYGATPKLLSRKYRALQAAVRLGLSDDQDVGWEEVTAGAFYDQSHFIRDFKRFIGLTPGQFLDRRKAVIARLTIAERQKLATMPKLNLMS